MSVFCFLPWEGSIVGRGLDPSAAARGLAALQAHRSPAARYDSYPQPGGINPPLRFSCRGAASPTPRRSAAVNGKDVGRPRGRGRTCAARSMTANDLLWEGRGPGMPGPYHIVPGGIFHPGLFLCGIVNFYTAFYSAAIAQIVANLACSMQNRPFVILGCLTCF